MSTMKTILMMVGGAVVAPSDPTSVVLTNGSGSNMDAGWTAPTLGGVPDYYETRFIVNSTPPYVDMSSVTHPTVTKTFNPTPEASAFDDVQFEVRAVNSGGASNWVVDSAVFDG